MGGWNSSDGGTKPQSESFLWKSSSTGSHCMTTDRQTEWLDERVHRYGRHAGIFCDRKDAQIRSSVTRTCDITSFDYVVSIVFVN